jgi:hypothetical protein
MSKKNEVEVVEMSKFAGVVAGILAGERVSVAGLTVGERFFIAELSHEGKRAEFARQNLLRDTLDESRKALSEYMKGIREGLGSPKSDDELYKISERVRKALSIALDREFPEESAKKRAPRTPEEPPVQGKAITTGAGEEEGEGEGTSSVSPELALSQLESNLNAVMNTALKAGAGTKADLFQFAVMTLKQWVK